MKKVCSFLRALIGVALLSVSAVQAGVNNPGAASAPSPPPLAQGWHQTVLGGGGYIVGSDFPATGVRFVRTDSNGAYIWDTTNSRWYNLLCKACIPDNATANALNLGYYPRTGGSQQNFGGPASVVVNSVTVSKQDYGNGVLEMVGAPNASNVAYFYYSGHLLVSTNVDPANTANITFTDTLFLGGIGDSALNCGSNWRANNHVVAVDPNNKDHVIVATQTCAGSPQTGGFYESFNATSGGSSTWAKISSAVVPAPTVINQAGYIAFDPNSGTTTCSGSVCTNKVYIWTSGTTAGVYSTTNGATASLALMTGSPATAQQLVVNGDPVTANGGGDVFVVDGANEVADGNVWRFHSGAWTKTLNGVTFGGVHAIAINPLNGTHVVAVTPSNPIVSSDNGATWVKPATLTLAGGDSPWQIAIDSRRFLSTGSVTFDPINNDQFFFTGGQGAWKSQFSTTSITYTAMTAGIENLSPGFSILVSSAYQPTYGVRDQAGCKFDVRTNSYASPPTNCFPLSGSKGLLYVTDLSTPGSHPAFALAKVTNFNGSLPDYSGYSTDGFGSNFVPFNTWNAIVNAGTFTSDSGSIQVNVPSTTGLTTWSNGSGSIVCSYPSKVGLTGTDVLNGGLVGFACWEAINVQATTFTLRCLGLNGPCAFANLAPNIGQTYTFYAPSTSLFSSYNGQLAITGVTSNAGKVQVTINSNASSYLGASNGNTPICISGVTMTTTTVVNGCWLTSSVSGLNVTLADSTFVGGDAYISGGIAVSWLEPAGNLVASTTTNFAEISANNAQLKCTTDGGKTWTELTGNSTLLPYANTTVTGGPYSAGATSITVSSASGFGTNTLFSLYLDDGRPLFEKASSVVGSTINFNNAIPTGASITAGNKVTLNNGFILTTGDIKHSIVADQVAANTFFAVHDNLGLLKFTNCNQPTVVNSNTIGTAWMSGASNQWQLEMVAGESGHGFFSEGYSGGIGATNPNSGGLWRFCNGDSNSAVTMQQVPGAFGVRSVGLGAPLPGHLYPSIVFSGWYDAGNVRANSVYGTWLSIDDPNHGNTGSGASCTLNGNTWRNIDGYLTGWQTELNKISGDPFVPGLFYANSTGLFWGYFP